MTDANDLKLTPADQAKLAAMTKELDALEKQAGLHSISRKLFSLAIGDDGLTWLKEMPEGGAAQIWSWLDAMKGSDQLPFAVFTVLRVAAFLDQDLHLGKIAFDILMIGNDAVVKYGLLKTVTTTDLDAGKREAAIKKNTGGAARAQPAKVGDKAPEGSLRVDQITPGGKRKL